MTKPIEAVVAEALDRFQRTGRLDMDAYAAAYPEHAEELQQLLPLIRTVQDEQRWAAVEQETRSQAHSMFAQVSGQAAAPATLGALFAQERADTGLSVAEQAQLSGLPAKALAELATDPTPVAALDNLTVKKLANRVSAPFTALLKEVRRLSSLQALQRANLAPTFTRDASPSTEQEQEELVKKVQETARKRARKPPGEN